MKEEGIFASRAVSGERLSKGGNGRRTDQEAEEINEMTSFADKPPPTLLRISQPMFGRQRAGIDAVLGGEGGIGGADKFMERRGEGGKAAVEADCKQRRAFGSDGLLYGSELFGVEGQRLFAVDRFAGFEGGERLGSVQMMASEDGDGVDGFVFEDARLVRGSVGEAETGGEISVARCHAGSPSCGAPAGRGDADQLQVGEAFESG